MNELTTKEIKTKILPLIIKRIKNADEIIEVEIKTGGDNIFVNGWWEFIKNGETKFSFTIYEKDKDERKIEGK